MVNTMIDTIMKPLRPLTRASLCITILTGALVGMPSVSKSATIEGVEFPDAIQLATDPDRRLRLHGLGLLRYRVVFRGYVAALYLPEGISGDRALTDVPRRLELSYFWSIGAEDFAEAANQILARDLDATELEALRPRLEALHRSYRDVSPNDRYALTYLPDVGTELRLNEELLVTIPGEDFARAYFGIWLGERPLDEGLRRDLLTPR